MTAIGGIDAASLTAVTLSSTTSNSCYNEAVRSRSQAAASSRTVDCKSENRMPSYSIDGIVPVVDPSSYVHPLASLIGDVIIGPCCYIGPFASLRGDFGRIVLERGSNVQDSCTIHTGLGTDTLIGQNGHIGHGAILHGCQLLPNVLIGMGATVMDGALIGEDSIVGAMAYVKARFQVPPKVLVTGIPARIIRTLSENDMAGKIAGTQLYQTLAQRSLIGLRQIEPLRNADSDRLQKRIEHHSKS